jgi:molybdenum cofactor cytidylyltransferase
LTIDKQIPVAGIIIAAGGSSRFGKPKQLLEWRGESFINRAIATAFAAGLDPVVLVLGAFYDQIKENIRNRPGLRIVQNENWANGQSTSLKTGIKNLDEQSLPFVFMLVDQPRITAELILDIINEYQATDAEIVVTKTNKHRSPPILFDPVCIDELNKLEGDEGGRKLMDRFVTREITAGDPLIASDIDTEEDYKKLTEL